MSNRKFNFSERKKLLRTLPLMKRRLYAIENEKYKWFEIGKKLLRIKLRGEYKRSIDRLEKMIPKTNVIDLGA